MSEFAELVVMVAFICKVVIVGFIEIFCFLVVVTWREGKNKYIDLLMIKQIT